MRRTGKWLAVFLSVTMLAGTAPVYGADISVESDFSSETTDEDVLTDELEGTETTNEPGSGETVSDDQEIIEEPDSDEVEFSADDLADDQEDNTEDVSIEDSDEDLADIAVEDIQDAGESETKEYLKNLSVYSGYGVKDPLEISRREDLDATYGGKTYTVEIGSSYNSTGFYVTADIGLMHHRDQRFSCQRVILMEKLQKARSLQPDIQMESVIVSRIFLQKIMEKERFIP